MASKSKAEGRAAKAAEFRAAQKAAERRRTVLSVTGVVLAMILIIGAGFLIQRSRDTSTDVTADAAGTGDHGVVIGPDDAPHDVVIYEDFLCPYCGALEKASRDDLSRLADEGKVQVEYRPFDLLSRISDYSARATNAFAVVLDAEGPAIAKKFHDLLYENQPSEEGPFPDNAALLDLAVQAGATEADVSDGITNETMSDWVDEATQAAIKAGVQGTPTVLLDGKVIQGSMDDIAQTLVDKIG